MPTFGGKGATRGDVQSEIQEAFPIEFGAQDGTEVYPTPPDLQNLDSAAAAGSFGSWVQLAAAVSDPFWLAVLVIHDRNTATDRPFELQVGEGAAGSESAIHSVHGWFDGNLHNYIVPILVPRKVTGGPRLAVRVQDNNASALTYSVQLQGVS